jgi:hypothetical protein
VCLSFFFALVAIGGVVWVGVQWAAAGKLSSQLKNNASCRIASEQFVAIPKIATWSSIFATACWVDLTVDGHAIDASFSTNDGLTKVTFDYPRRFPWLSLRSCEAALAQHTGNFACTYAPGTQFRGGEDPSAWGVYAGDSSEISSLAMALAHVSETGLLFLACPLALAWVIVYALYQVGVHLCRCAHARGMLLPMTNIDTVMLGYQPLADGTQPALSLA